jgi:hypothetical protein
VKVWPVALSVVLVGFTAAALAQDRPPPRPHVAVLAAPDDDRVLVEATARVRLELTASGLTSVLVAAADQDVPARIAFVRDQDGIATIDLVALRPDATPWHRRIPVPASATGGDDATVLALRAVELLRGIRLEVRREVHPQPPTPPAPAVAPPRTGPGWRLMLGPTVLEGRPWGASLAPGVAFGVVAPLTPHLSLTATLAGPFFNDLPATGVGSARTREELGFLGVRVHLQRTPFGAHGVLGGGLHHLVATYDRRGIPPATPGALHVVTGQSLWTPCLAVGAGVSAQYGSRFGVSLDLAAIVTRQTIDVVVNDRTLGVMGAPSLLETLSAWVAFP